MNYKFYDSLKLRMKDERKNYLDLCHTKECEVFKRSRYGHKSEFFYVDGIEIEMPEQYQSTTKYKKYLFNEV